MARRAKLAACVRCCPDGGAILAAEVTADGKRIWRCNNCGLETDRGEKTRATAESPLTPNQLQAITRIQRYNVDEAAKYGNKSIEVKRFQLRSFGAFVSVIVETGRIGDEGSLAAVLCRQRGSFLVHRGGRIEAIDPAKHATKADARRHPLIYGWRT